MKNIWLKILPGMYLAALMISLVPVPSEAQESTQPMTLQTLSIRYADLEEIRQTVEPLAGPEGRVTVNRARRQLMIMAPPDRIGTIEDLVKKLDTPPKNVRITVRFQDASVVEEAQAGVRARGTVVVKGGNAGGQAEINPFVQSRETVSDQTAEQTLMVMSGRVGTLRVGERIPYPEYFIQYGIHHGYIETQIQWEDAGASLLVEPTVIGDGPMIHVRLTPEISARQNGNLHRIQYASAATEVTVQNGQTVNIGGLKKDEDFYSRFLLGFRKGRGSRNLDIFLTPEILVPHVD